MKELTDKLAAIGAPTAEEDQVVTLLGSLPQSYSTLVTALEAQVDGIDLKFVQQALIHEEQKQRKQADGTSSGVRVQLDSVLVGAQSTQHKNFRNPVKCYGCGAFGHIRRDCPNIRKKQQVGSSMFHKARTFE